MAAKPLTTEAIAITEKKMDMSLDDIIKMSKNTGNNKAKNQRRFPNKMQKFSNNAAQDKSRRLQRFMDSRSSLRQGALAMRRSNFQGNQFAIATEVARKAAVAPIRQRGFNRSRASNWNKTRIDGPLVLRKSANVSFIPKARLPLVQSQGNAMPRQRPQTLDLLFANMKEQRLKKVLSQRQNGGARRNGGRQQRPPWGRGRLSN